MHAMAQGNHVGRLLLLDVKQGERQREFQKLHQVPLAFDLHALNTLSGGYQALSCHAGDCDMLQPAPNGRACAFQIQEEVPTLNDLCMVCVCAQMVVSISHRATLRLQYVWHSPDRPHQLLHTGIADRLSHPGAASDVGAASAVNVVAALNLMGHLLVNT